MEPLQLLLQLVDILRGLVESVKLGEQGLEYSVEAGGLWLRLSLGTWATWAAWACVWRIQLARRGGRM